VFFRQQLLTTPYVHVVFTLPRHLAPLSQKLSIHPHVHCVVPAGGLSPDQARWVRSRGNYFLPKKVLRKIFRGKFVDALRQAFQNGRLHFQGDLKLLAQPKTFAAWLRSLYRQDWVVYLKPPLGGPEYVLPLPLATEQISSSALVNYASEYSFAIASFWAPDIICPALSHSLGAPSHRSFPQLNLHNTRVRCNHGRPRSNGLIERAQSILPNFTTR
jgi:hypothetical protein